MGDRDLVFYVQLHLKPEHVQEWQQALSELAEKMAQEETFVSCTLHQDVQDANRFTLYERWREASVEAFMQHQVTDKPYRQIYETHLPQWLQTPRTASVVRHMQEWRKK